MLRVACRSGFGVRDSEFGALVLRSSFVVRRSSVVGRSSLAEQLARALDQLRDALAHVRRLRLAHMQLDTWRQPDALPGLLSAFGRREPAAPLRDQSLKQATTRGRGGWWRRRALGRGSGRGKWLGKSKSRRRCGHLSFL